MPRIKLYPLHTFLFIPFIVVFLYAQNLSQTKLYMTYRTLWIGTIFCILLFSALYIFLRKRLKAGILATFLLFVLFQYGVIYEFFETLYYAGKWPLKNIHRYLLVIYALAYIFLIWKVKRTTRDLVKINYFLNALVILLLIFNLLRIAFGGYSAKQKLKTVNAGDFNDHITFATGKQRPDIYFFILDGYASNSVLSKYYQFDNAAFTGSLKAKGFRFCDSAFSNYYYTSGSLAATLNFNYPADSLNQNQLIRDNRLFRVLKENGYKICHLKSGYAVSAFFELANKTVYIDGPNEFEKSLLKYTILRLDDLIGLFAHQRLSSQFAKAPQLITDSATPKLCFIHIVAPHPPYIFDRNGNMRTKHQFAEHSWEPKEYYVDQLIYVNNQIDALLTQLISVNKNAVVVIESDHGPWISAPTRKDVFEARSQILYSYYAPQNIKIPQRTSSVNTFRYLLNGLFGCKLDTLPDLYAGKADLLNDPILLKKASR